MAGDQFTRDRLEWLDDMATDPSVTPPAFRLAYVLSGYINRETGEAWPSQEKLARELGTTDRTIRTLTEILVRAGHLKVVSGGGRNRSNRYRISSQTRKLASAKDTETRKPTSGNNVQPRKPASGNEPETRKPASGYSLETRKPASGDRMETRKSSVEKPGSRLPTNSLIEPSESISSCRRAFDRWFAQYPLHVGEAEAWREYGKIVGRGTASHDQLLAGVLRYAAEMSGQEQFVKEPSKWLKGRRWKDQPRPSRSQAAASGNRPLKGAASAIAGIFGDDT